jgi:glycosyltransferase involved in cell wall biosynthesis
MAHFIIEECHKRDMQDNCFFPWHLRSVEKEKLFAISDIYILPSLAEPFGITPVEVMKYDIPIIMTEGLGAHEIIPEALEFQYNNSSDLTDKINLVLNSQQEKESIIKNYGKNLDRLDWNISARKVKALYYQLLGLSFE